MLKQREEEEKARRKQDRADAIEDGRRLKEAQIEEEKQHRQAELFAQSGNLVDAEAIFGGNGGLDDATSPGVRKWSPKPSEPDLTGVRRLPPRRPRRSPPSTAPPHCFVSAPGVGSSTTIF